VPIAVGGGHDDAHRCPNVGAASTYVGLVALLIAVQLLPELVHGLRSLRVGSYRIIYQLAENEQVVRVAAIRHRSIAYRIDPR